MSNTLKIDSATGGVWERIGQLFTDRGLEDASGARRCFLNAMVEPDYDRCRRMAPGLTNEEIDELRAAAVEEFGPPE